jgi:hypothetical protein
MLTVSMLKRPVASTLALAGMTASLLALAPAVHAQGLLGSGDLGSPANPINAPADPEGGSPAPGQVNALVAPAPGTLIFGYYDTDGPGVLKFLPAGGNQFQVRLFQNGVLFQGQGVQVPLGGGVYRAQFRVGGVLFDGRIYDHATFGLGYYFQYGYWWPWYINRIWGQGVPFTMNGAGVPIPNGTSTPSTGNSGNPGNPGGGGTGGNGTGPGISSTPSPDPNSGNGGGLFGSDGP